MNGMSEKDERDEQNTEAQLQADFLDWTGGFEPEDEEQIDMYIRIGMVTDIDPLIAGELLIAWMEETKAAEKAARNNGIKYRGYRIVQDGKGISPVSVYNSHGTNIQGHASVDSAKAGIDAHIAHRDDRRFLQLVKQHQWTLEDFSDQQEPTKAMLRELDRVGIARWEGMVARFAEQAERRNRKNTK